MTCQDHQRAISGSAPRIGQHREHVSSDAVTPDDTNRSDDRKGVAPR
jgi:hypothetical protein